MKTDFFETVAAAIHRQFVQQSTYVVADEATRKALECEGWELIEESDDSFVMRKDIPPSSGVNRSKGFVN
jgi:hypothetical protein